MDIKLKDFKDFSQHDIEQFIEEPSSMVLDRPWLESAWDEEGLCER